MPSEARAVSTHSDKRVAKDSLAHAMLTSMQVATREPGGLLLFRAQ